jgi:hypothetical protein
VGRIVFSLLALGGFFAGLLAGGALGAYLALSGTPEPAPSPARFTPMREKPAAGLNPTVPLPVRAQRAVPSAIIKTN